MFEICQICSSQSCGTVDCWKKRTNCAELHMFCANCIQKWINMSNPHIVCPLCKNHITQYDDTELEIIEPLVDDIFNKELHQSFYLAHMSYTARVKKTQNNKLKTCMTHRRTPCQKHVSFSLDKKCL